GGTSVELLGKAKLIPTLSTCCRLPPSPPRSAIMTSGRGGETGGLGSRPLAATRGLDRWVRDIEALYNFSPGAHPPLRRGRVPHLKRGLPASRPVPRRGRFTSGSGRNDPQIPGGPAAP